MTTAIQDALWATGPQAAHILDLWRLTLAVCCVVFVAVLLACAFALKGSSTKRPDAPPDLSGLDRLERGPRRSVAIALVVSTVLLLALLVASVLTDRALAALPLRDALHIELTGHQWWWSVRYDDTNPSRIVETANELHLPVGKPVLITLRSTDVIHSLWIPNLAGKKDLIPGRTTVLALRADREGTYRAQCAEFCGWQHAWMALPVTVESADAFEHWMQGQRKPALAPTGEVAMRGQRLVLSGDCVMCHTIVGTDAAARLGPDLTHLASRPTLGAGVLPNDAGHLAAWVRDPSRHKPGVNMPPHDLPPDDLAAIVAYLQSLQ
jgi:cytochrome c oxidase subunit II